MFEIAVGATVLYAVLMAVATSLLGYLRNTPPERFNAGKFFATIIIGVIVGFLTGALGWTYESAAEWLASSGLTVWIYWLAQIIARRLPAVAETS